MLRRGGMMSKQHLQMLFFDGSFSVSRRAVFLNFILWSSFSGREKILPDSDGICENKRHDNNTKLTNKEFMDVK